MYSFLCDRTLPWSSWHRLALFAPRSATNRNVLYPLVSEITVGLNSISIQSVQQVNRISKSNFPLWFSPRLELEFHFTSLMDWIEMVLTPNMRGKHQYKRHMAGVITTTAPCSLTTQWYHASLTLMRAEEEIFRLCPDMIEEEKEGDSHYNNNNKSVN